MKTFYEFTSLLKEHELKPLTIDDMQTTSAEDAIAWYKQYGKNTSKLGTMTDEEFNKHHGLVENPQIGNDTNPDAPDVMSQSDTPSEQPQVDAGPMVSVPGYGSLTKDQARQECIDKLQEIVNSMEQQEPIDPEKFDTIRDLYQAASGKSLENDEDKSSDFETNDDKQADMNNQADGMNPPQDVGAQQNTQSVGG